MDCSDLNPGVATTNKEFNGVVFEDYYMYCPADNADIDLSGNHLEDEYSVMTVLVRKCEPSIFLICAGDEEFTEWHQNSMFAFFMPQSTLQLKEKDEVLSIHYHKVFENRFDLSFQQYYRVYLRFNEASFSNSLVANMLATTDEFTFLSLSRHQILNRNPMPEW